MCDFRKLNDMVLASLSFVEEWSRVQAHRDQLEVALAGVAALMLAVGSQYKLTAGGAVLCGGTHFGCHREHIHALSSHGSCRCHKPKPIC